MLSSENRRVDLPPWSFWEVRRGSGTPVVLLHGLSGSSRWWGRNIDALSKHHLVTALDLIGFGRNRKFFRKTPLPPGFDAIASLLISWMEENFDEPVHLVGHSMGGQIAIHIANDRPDLVRSLVLVSSAGIPFSIDPRAHVGGLGKPPKGWFRFGRLVAGDFLRAGPTSVAVASARILLDDAREAMRSVEAPTLIIWGENDPLIPLRYGEEIEREIPGARLVVLPATTHVPMWENSAAFNKAVLDFFRAAESLPSPIPRASSSFSWKVEQGGSRVAFRRTGTDVQVVLVHGLGMSSAYFGPLARAFRNAGIRTIAPDLPGFGASADGPEVSPQEQAERLLAFCRSMGVTNAVWLGHSTGAQVVYHAATLDHSVVAGAVYLAPIWNRFRHPFLRLFTGLLTDIPREHLSLLMHALRDYWRAGILRWARNFLRFSADASERPVILERSLFLAGDRDPLMDWEWLELLAGGPVKKIPGAHAVNDSAPVETVTAVQPLIDQWIRESRHSSPPLPAGE
ncbi:MAG TPA: alpha/beta fold hydrolase, partial [Thermoanaerobaculia bacterium]|nr:alpha/beta fold hydrolase [Thermoanaerobaculia bacterium]